MSGLRDVVEQVLYDYVAEMEAPFNDFRWLKGLDNGEKQQEFCNAVEFYENLTVDTMAFLFGAPVSAVVKGKQIGGILSKQFEALDSYLFVGDSAYIAQAKSSTTRFGESAVSKWLGQVVAFVNREPRFAHLTPSTERVAILAHNGSYTRSVTDDALKRMRDGFPHWTLLLFKSARRGRARIFSPYDEFSLRWVSPGPTGLKQLT